MKLNQIITDLYNESKKGKINREKILNIVKTTAPNFTWKMAWDLVESSKVKYLLETSEISLALAKEIQEKSIQSHERNLEQLTLQQFSTPIPIGYLISVAAGITNKDTILEPSTGTGILVGCAIAGIAKPKLILNEIGTLRRQILQEIFKQQIFSIDAEYINDYLPISERPTCVIMNPPFSRSVGSQKADPTTAQRHIRSALLSCVNQGRIVTLAPSNLKPEKATSWFKSLPATILASIKIPGKFYNCHGTTVDTRILVWDRVEGNQLCESVDNFQTLEEIEEYLLTLPPRLTITPSTNLEVKFDLPLFTTKIEPIESNKDLPLLIEDDTPKLIKITYTKAAKENKKLETNIFETYKPELIIEQGVEHPADLVESAAMSSISSPEIETNCLLPEIALNWLSKPQLESIIYARAAHEQLLDSRWTLDPNTKEVSLSQYGVKYTKGYYNGDGTGCGKGSIAAGIVQSYWVEGKQKGVWLTKNYDLLEDSRKYWMAVGGKAHDIVPLNTIKVDKPINLKKGILLVSYATLRSSSKEGKSRLSQILNWLGGSDFDGPIVLDECHLLGGAVSETVEGFGNTKASAQGVKGLELINSLPKAKISYFSATGASKPSSLGYLNRLGLWDTKEFGNFSREEFLNLISSSGYTGMEVLIQELKSKGLYHARNLSFEGVEYEHITTELGEEQTECWNTYAKAYQRIHTNIMSALKLTNAEKDGRVKGQYMSAFESSKLRFFEELLINAKVPAVIKLIERELNDNRSVVIQIVNTGESNLDRLLAEIPTNYWNDINPKNISARATILEYLNNSFPTTLYQHYTDEYGNEKIEPAKDHQGKIVKNREATEIRDRLIDEIASLPPISSALDLLIWHFGSNKIAEVTGRTKRIVYENDRYQVKTRNAENVTEVENFQNGDKRILIFSRSGNTGKSYHSDLNCKNQQPRTHIVLQAGYSAIEAVQGIGRSHRSNQCSAPKVVTISTNLRGETRFVSTICSRLKSLGALTKGQRDTNTKELFDDELNNFTSIYGAVALEELMKLISRGKIENYPPKKFEDLTGINPEREITINRFLNRILALKIEDQNYLFEVFEEIMKEKINKAKEEGSYDQGMKSLRGDFNLVETIALNKDLNLNTFLEYKNPCITEVSLAKSMIEKGGKIWRNKKTLAIAVSSEETSTKTNPEGIIVSTSTIYRPVSKDLHERIDTQDLESKWMEMPDNSLFWEEWQKLINNAKPYSLKCYLITGSLLPNWKKLGNYPSIVRLQDQNNTIHTGVKIQAKDLVLLKQNFNANISLTAENCLETLNKSTESVRWGDWKLQRSRVFGEDRLEIIGVWGKKLDRLEIIGCCVEIIGHDKRAFLPRTEEDALLVMETLSSLPN